MFRPTVILTSVTILLLPTITQQANALEYRDLIGSWVGEANGERIEFRRDGDVIDFRMGQARFTAGAGVVSHAANMALVFQGNRWCYYEGQVSDDGRTLFLAWRREQDPWTCTAGRFTKVR